MGETKVTFTIGEQLPRQDCDFSLITTQNVKEILYLCTQLRKKS